MTPRPTPAVLSPEAVIAAGARIKGLIRRTPTVQVDASSVGLRAPAFFKLEQLQHSGSFKARGAVHFTSTQPIGAGGVVAASGGNHGAAVAFAAQRAGHRATVFVPTIASTAKVERLFALGANVRQTGEVYADALEASEKYRSETDATPIHAYNDPIVMAGAGTVALEFEQQVATLSGTKLDTMLIACGGGGLAGGMAAYLNASTRLVLCETDGTQAFAAAVAAGSPTDVTVSGVAADSLGASQLGENPWAALSAIRAKRHDAVVSAVVSDQDIRSAQKRLWDSLRVAVEPAAAAPLAAILSGAYRAEPEERVGLVLCGANTSITFG